MDKPSAFWMGKFDQNYEEYSKSFEQNYMIAKRGTFSFFPQRMTTLLNPYGSH